MHPVSTKESVHSNTLSPQEIARSKAKEAAKLRRSLSCLVPIQPNGSKRPFFCIHPQAGVVFPYYELAFLLGEEQPFYGLQSLGIASQIQPLTSIEEMATRYIQAVRKIQPKGPYALGGWSLGAIIAFEMARQLQQAGESVLLVSLDGPASSTSKFINGREIVRFLFASALRYIWPYVFDYLKITFLATQTKQPVGEGQSNQAKLQSSSRTVEIAKAIAQKAEKAEFRQSAIRRLLPLLWANTKAVINYKPQVYPGRMILLRSRTHFGNFRQEPTLGWCNLVQGEVEIIKVPGHHLNILRQPNVQVLAEKLRMCLEQLED